MRQNSYWWLIETFLMGFMCIWYQKNTRYFDLLCRSSFSGMTEERRRRFTKRERGSEAWEDAHKRLSYRDICYEKGEVRKKGKSPPPPLHISTTFFRKEEAMPASLGGPPSLHSSRVLVHIFPWRSRDFHGAVYHSKEPFCFYQS